ncbi:MAG: hypothetical protein GY953_46845, partial [bacterium]|nr:hypothetical protein [bacterium]
AGVAEHLAPELTAEALPCESVEVELTPVVESAPKPALPGMAQPVSMADSADRNESPDGPESGTEPVASLADAPVIPATSREAPATGLQPFSEPAASEELHGAAATEVDGEEEMPTVVEPLVDGLASPGLPNLSAATTTRGLAEDLLTGIAEAPQDDYAAPEIAAEPLVSAAAAGESLPDGATSASGIDWNALDAAEQARTGLVKLGLGRVVPLDSATEHRTALTPRAMAPKPMPPPSGLQTIPEHRPIGMPFEPPGDPVWKRALGPIIERSQNLPGSMKWIGAVVVLLVAYLLWVPQAPTEALAAEESTDQGVSLALASHWQSFQDDISSRAAVSLVDDFREGLGNWEGGDNWAKTWSYDGAGYVRPGALALYSPSLGLSDYRMAFSGRIDRGGLSWAVRAADNKNYYALRLFITEPGPLPRGAIVRYPVIDGRRGKATRTPLPFTLRNNQMHQLRTQVRGDRFTVHVDGQLVDYWNEPKLPQGGVGFFKTRGERNRLRWVSVTHQYDLLGRLCALLAPYNLDYAPRSIER